MSKNEKKGKLGIIIFAAILGVALVAAGIIYCKLRQRPEKFDGKKSITILVVDNKQTTTEYKLQTDADYLRKAMDEAKEQGFSYEGDESTYGLYLKKVNGIRADYEEDNAYWSILVNGEYGMNSADTQPVNNGDSFSFVYTPNSESMQ